MHHFTGKSILHWAMMRFISPKYLDTHWATRIERSKVEIVGVALSNPTQTLCSPHTRPMRNKVWGPSLTLSSMSAYILSTVHTIQMKEILFSSPLFSRSSFSLVPVFCSSLYLSLFNPFFLPLWSSGIETRIPIVVGVSRSIPGCWALVVQRGIWVWFGIEK